MCFSVFFLFFCVSFVSAQDKTEAEQFDNQAVSATTQAACSPGIVIQSVVDLPGAPVGFKVQFNLTTKTAYLYNTTRQLKVVFKNLTTGMVYSKIIFGSTSGNPPYNITAPPTFPKGKYAVYVKTVLANDGNCTSPTFYVTVL